MVPEPQKQDAQLKALEKPFGVEWNNLRADGREFILSHLRPFDLTIPIQDGPVTIRVAFGHHVFTDEKEVGPKFNYRDEVRYLSTERIDRSQALRKLLESKFGDEHSRACRTQSGAKQFFMLHESDWAIFYDLRLRDADARVLTMLIITAYTLNETSRLSVPGRFHELYANQVILTRLLARQKLNHDYRGR